MCGDVSEVNLFGFCEITHVVIPQVDVAAAFEIYGVFGLLNASLVVFVNERSIVFGETELFEEHICVDKATSGFECGVVFGFGGGESRCFLEGGRPIDKVVAVKY